MHYHRVKRWDYRLAPPGPSLRPRHGSSDLPRPRPRHQPRGPEIPTTAPNVAWPLSAMTLVQATTSMALVTVPVLTPEIAAALDVTTALIGPYQSIAYAGGAILTLLSGSLVLRYGGIRINQVSVVLSAIGVGLAITGMAPAIALGGVLAGMGYGLATPGASHVLARVAPPARVGLVFSIKQSAVPLGGSSRAPSFLQWRNGSAGRERSRSRASWGCRRRCSSSRSGGGSTTIATPRTG